LPGCTKPIEDIGVGDLVWATDPETGEVGPRPVTDLIVGTGDKTLVDITIDGDTITATDEHPFWVNNQGQWVDAEDLQPGDLLLGSSGATISIDDVTVRRVADEAVHNLTVADLRTYHVQTGPHAVLVHNCAPSGLALSPRDVRFSQSSVNGVDEIASSMGANGWVGDPIDVVRMPDGTLTTIDNTRLLAANEAGINVQANIHAFDDVLPSSFVDRFTTPKGGVPATWGDAVLNRIGGQNAPFRSSNPFGSWFTGWGGG
jgi:hypothetical protein